MLEFLHVEWGNHHMHNDTKCLFVSVFPIQKARFEEIKYKKLVWLGIKHNFLEKVAFWVCEENAQCHKGAQRRILEKACACWLIYFGLTGQLPNYPSINKKMFSVLTPDSSFLSSHLSALPFKKTDLTHFYRMSLAVGKKSSSSGKEDRWWRIEVLFRSTVL